MSVTRHGTPLRNSLGELLEDAVSDTNTAATASTASKKRKLDALVASENGDVAVRSTSSSSEHAPFDTHLGAVFDAPGARGIVNAGNTVSALLRWFCGSSTQFDSVLWALVCKRCFTLCF